MDIKTRFGIFLIIIGIINIIKGTESIDSMIKMIPLIIIFVGAGFWMIISANKKKREEEKLKQQKQLSKQKREQENDEITNIKLNNVDKLIEQLAEVNKLNIPNIDEFKNTIIKNEVRIIEKGGDSQLFSFLKIDTFLKDFRIRIIEDQKGLTNLLDENWLKSRIKEESKRDDLEKIADGLERGLAILENRKAKDFDSNVDSLFILGDKMKPIVINQIKTMEFYENISLAMIVFYLEDKKIRYFEIHEAFEKLGVFDSTWEKNVLNKLDRIEIRLAQISNQLTELNQNFTSLVESSQNIVSELKEINSNIITNNMLQAITAYQTWRINKNTKSLRN